MAMLDTYPVMGRPTTHYTYMSYYHTCTCMCCCTWNRQMRKLTKSLYSPHSFSASSFGYNGNSNHNWYRCKTPRDSCSSKIPRIVNLQYYLYLYIPQVRSSFVKNQEKKRHIIICWKCQIDVNRNSAIVLKFDNALDRRGRITRCNF